jgi:hypothetical protein
MRLPLTQRQLDFVEAEVDNLLYGGAAGGGKSYAQVADALIYAAKYAGSKQLVLRRSFPELKRSIILLSLGMYPAEIATYRETDHVWTFKNGSTIEFGYCERENDVYRYQGAEYDVIRVDELTHFTETMFRYLKSRIRGVNNFPKSFRGSTNPGGIGHNWVKAAWITGKKPFETYTDEHGETWQFIPAKLTDNKPLMDADPTYVRKLDQLPETERRALRDGDWDIFEGQFLTEFSSLTMGIEPYYLHDGAFLYGSLDHGTTAPTSFGLWTVTSNRIPIRVASYYKGNTVTSVNSVAVAATVKGCKWSHGIPPRVVFCDPSMWTKARLETGYQPAPIDYYVKAFELEFAGFTEYKTQFVKANNDIRAGCAVLREYVRTVDGVPRIQYFKTSQNTPFELYMPLIQHDKHDPEIYDTTGEDHIVDDTRYLVMGIHGNDEMTPEARARRASTAAAGKGFGMSRYTAALRDVGCA